LTDRKIKVYHSLEEFNSLGDWKWIHFQLFMTFHLWHRLSYKGKVALSQWNVLLFLLWNLQKLFCRGLDTILAQNNDLFVLKQNCKRLNTKFSRKDYESKRKTFMWHSGYYETRKFVVTKNFQVSQVKDVTVGSICSTVDEHKNSIKMLVRNSFWESEQFISDSNKVPGWILWGSDVHFGANYLRRCIKNWYIYSWTFSSVCWLNNCFGSWLWTRHQVEVKKNSLSDSLDKAGKWE
jgi:hypothetical protein